ncbi:MAG: hypothetical protein ACK2UK_15860 [Candidatus Promineifilaceae bacterium]
MPTALIALMSPPLVGPALDQLPPVYKFAEVARDHGYDVVWTCSEAMAANVRRSYPSDQLRTYPNPTFLGTSRLLQPLFRRVLSADIPQRMLPGNPAERNYEWLFDSYVMVGFDDEAFFFSATEITLRALAEFTPEFLFTYGCPVGLTAGHISGVPVVTFDNLMRLRNDGGENYKRMNDTVQKAITIFSPVELPPLPLEDIVRNERQFRILSTIQHLHRKPYLDNEVFIGGFEPPEATLNFDEKPIKPTVDGATQTVYASFGSASISHRVVRKVLPAVFDQVNGLCATPYDCYVSSPFVEKPYREGPVFFAPLFDAAHIVPHCSYVMSHAGINSVMMALGHGVPLVMTPGAIQERRHNAREVLSVASGILVEIEDFTVPRLSSILLDRAQEQVLRQNARRTQQLIIQAGGMRHAFEEMTARWLAPYDKTRLQTIGHRLELS